MYKPATLITTALLSLGLATASMAAVTPKSTAPTAADTGTATAPAKSHKSGKSGKSHKSSKSHKSTTPPATSK